MVNVAAWVSASGIRTCETGCPPGVKIVISLLVFIAFTGMIVLVA